MKTCCDSISAYGFTLEYPCLFFYSVLDNSADELQEEERERIKHEKKKEAAKKKGKKDDDDDDDEGEVIVL